MVVATVQTQKQAFHIAESHTVLQEKTIRSKERHHKRGRAVSFFTAIHVTKQRGLLKQSMIWFESRE